MNGGKFVPGAGAVVVTVLWIALIVVVAGTGYKALQGCGIRLPNGAPLIAWCPRADAASEVATLHHQRREANDQIMTLIRRIRESPACPETCIFSDRDDMVDVYMLQDLSSSFRADLPNLRRAIEGLRSRWQAGGLPDGFGLGLGSFTDKPTRPFGNDNDYTFRPEVRITSDIDVVIDAVSALSTVSGGHTPEEAQLEAMMAVMVRAEELGFRPESNRFLVVVTDAPAHEAGDWDEAPGPASVDGDGGLDPLSMDYPSRELVYNRLFSSGITPIFLVANNSAREYYRSFVGEYGAGIVIEISNNSENLLDAIIEGILGVCTQQL